MKITLRAYVHGVHIDTFHFGVDETKSNEAIKAIDITHLFRDPARYAEAFRQQLLPFHTSHKPKPTSRFPNDHA